MNFIKVENLEKSYFKKGVKSEVLSGINLEIAKGDFIGIMGPSGAGKSTLLNLLSTIDRATKGKILFNNKEIILEKDSSLAKFRREKIGFIFQDFNLLDNMKVKDNIALPLALSKHNPNEINKKIDELSNFFEINQHLEKYPYQLSGGQKQRVAAARALITNPEIIFADEPTGQLDSKSSTELLNYMEKINKKFNTTIFMVTHDSMAASYCHRIYYIKDGRICAKLDKSESRKDFFKNILNMISTFGGAINECI